MQTLLQLDKRLELLVVGWIHNHVEQMMKTMKTCYTIVLDCSCLSWCWTVCQSLDWTCIWPTFCQWISWFSVNNDEIKWIAVRIVVVKHTINWSGQCSLLFSYSIWRSTLYLRCLFRSRHLKCFCLLLLWRCTFKSLFHHSNCHCRSPYY